MPDRPFKSDGCSGGMSWAWRLVTGAPPPWEGCCFDHDTCYWLGGTPAQRALADRELMAKVTLTGHPVIAFAMWLAVRVGGHPLLPLPWRWGYGWHYPRAYSEEKSP